MDIILGLLFHTKERITASKYAFLLAMNHYVETVVKEVLLDQQLSTEQINKILTQLKKTNEN